MRKPSAVKLLAALLAAALLVLAAPVAGAGAAERHARLTPVVFVHGGFGSGGQFESQAMRLTSNGYPRHLIRVFEYDSLSYGATATEVHARLDALIADVQRQTGRSKVDVLGHSLGTTLMHAYLASPERAADVRRYVNIDGRTAAAPPGGVPTLAIWAGRGAPGREIAGARNVTIPNQTHVQVATSAESYVGIHRFLTGKRPRHGIVPQRRITLSGRAVLFPQNEGVRDRTLAIWEVAAGTGRRKGRGPVAVPALRADGSWGPVRGLRSNRRYEFTLTRPGEASVHHLYFEPFPRSDHLVRLLTSEPNAGADALIEKSPRHVSTVVLRYKELWGDQGAESDVLRFDGRNVLNGATSPIAKRAIGLFAFDRGSDGVTDLLTPIPTFTGLPFLTGVDVFVPAADPPDRTVRVALRSRGRGPLRRLSFPNFVSATDRVSLQFWDFEPRRVRSGSRRGGSATR
jgi:pimeloyl-ACP methyl ester carboxylesterase